MHHEMQTLLETLVDHGRIPLASFDMTFPQRLQFRAEKARWIEKNRIGVKITDAGLAALKAVGVPPQSVARDELSTRPAQ